jgi:uncharacterized repeat protein (TIGR03803 family)
MRSKKFHLQIAALMAILISFLAAQHAAAQTEITLYSFNGTSGYPLFGATIDSDGNLYGVSQSGAVWQLAPSRGAWTDNVLYNSAASGFNYSESIPTFDSKGDIYSATLYGGSAYRGTVIQLTPQPDGSWSETTLHTFSKDDGSAPDTQLVFDSAGNLYGTTLYGGAYNQGIVFKLTPQPDGTWTETIVHNFGKGSDGANPYGTLLLDSAGNIFGTTDGGGIYNSICEQTGGSCGIVFELSPTATGYTEKILHNFGNGLDGATPYAGLIFDSAGNLYGTTGYGGSHTWGTVFELIPQAGRRWKEKILHNFTGPPDGVEPLGGVNFDVAGNLYGTTFVGGGANGIAFELMPQSNGSWKEFILHSFGNEPSDGANPVGGLVFDGSGNLYGSAYAGGVYGAGTAFEIKH